MMNLAFYVSLFVLRHDFYMQGNLTWCQWLCFSEGRLAADFIALKSPQPSAGF
jgi:hypothetical protein